ncbi:putative YigZ family protein [Cytobacillus purgationiresistens]|uniref:YigZ family protein n=1 Tax=Cytobacillus purgationiresistens TaxID=863449 RepID=A0ABU0AG84_9BACI|nr:putative YigZ family protein [Cytobacillus purgationiresistens]
MSNYNERSRKIKRGAVLLLPHYLTVQGYGEHEINIQRSRFIAYVSRAETEEEAQAFIQKMKKQNWDATHNCSAYLIGENDHIQKANDDGEPSGTAGVPILEVLKKKQLKDTVVVITRYFGGIKLGAGGLIRAYGKATSEGIRTTGIVERQLMRVMHTKVDYTFLGKLENELRSSVYTIKDIHYSDLVEIETYTKEDESDTFSEWMVELTNGQATISQGDTLYLESTKK